jgi:hypothetical protein
MRRFSLTTRTCIFDEACTDAFLFIGLVLPTCLIQRLALNRICNICFPFVLRQKKKKKKKKMTHHYHRGDLCCAFEYLDEDGVKATTLC